ncbi:M18 family aminopeptidase [Psychrilyobacter sp.]|uniref:M18 family aminopeptidase n=1 Tax=Psychrilyobacter sp. TaxID=2586924 RepID=UPI003017BF93
MKKLANDFINFSHSSKSVFHAVKNTADILIANGYKEILESEKWKLEVSGKYFFTKNDSSLIAFSIGNGNLNECGFKISGNHTDSPGFRIKPKSEMVGDSYLRLNTEVYGGPILNTWLDRPLSIAGRVVVKSENVFKPKTILVNIDKPCLIIPNLAIHQNREVNKGVELNKQNDTLPILTLIDEELEKKNFLLKLIAEENNINLDEILDFDLYLYEFEKGTLVGLNEEMISAAKIDNLGALYVGLDAFLEAKEFNGVNVLACFDNEEIGSSTKQGADSNMLLNTLERISLSLGLDREEFFCALSNSFMLSVDGAHAVHPAQNQKTDPIIRPKMNHGVALKVAANQSYTSDAYSLAVVKQILEPNGIPYQYFVNRSDTPGGSTIGPISSTHLGINAVDLGLAMIGMHSIRELCGVEDLMNLKKLLKNYYSL